MSDRTLQKLFCSFQQQLSANQPLKNLKAIHALTHCRTPEMGVSYFTCKNNHPGIEQCHSCRHRSCYLCAEKARLDWIEKQKSRLLDTPHFHVIFTLPHEYLSLWRYNEAMFSHLLFKASQETLLELLGDERHGAITPGILMALHTWGRQLTLHPHTHCLVTAGGLTRSGSWQAKGKYLLPAAVIRQVYRGKVQANIKEVFEAGDLQLPPDMTEKGFWLQYRDLYQKSWSVRIEERYEHGKGVVLYLARYCKGGPLNPKQIKSVSHDHVEMSYLDHRDKRVKCQRLKPGEFLQRLLQHVPPKGVHTVRYYGLYAPASKAKYRRVCEVHSTLSESKGTASLDRLTMVLYCKTCGGQTTLSQRWWPGRQKGNSINKAGVIDRASDYLQQVDEADHANEVGCNSS